MFIATVIAKFENIHFTAKCGGMRDVLPNLPVDIDDVSQDGCGGWGGS